MATNFPAEIVVPDTSVVLKWYLQDQEQHRERALALRGAYLVGGLRLVVPDLLPYEVANVLRYKPHWDAARVGQAMTSLFALRLDVVPVSALILARAVDLAYDHDVAVYDAAFAALAKEVGGEFITADEKLVHKLARLPHVHSLGDLPLTSDGTFEWGARR